MTTSTPQSFDISTIMPAMISMMMVAAFMAIIMNMMKDPVEAKANSSMYAAAQWPPDLSSGRTPKRSRTSEKENAYGIGKGSGYGNSAATSSKFPGLSGSQLEELTSKQKQLIYAKRDQKDLFASASTMRAMVRAQQVAEGVTVLPSTHEMQLHHHLLSVRMKDLSLKDNDLDRLNIRIITLTKRIRELAGEGGIPKDKWES